MNTKKIVKKSSKIKKSKRTIKSDTQTKTQKTTQPKKKNTNSQKKVSSKPLNKKLSKKSSKMINIDGYNELLVHVKKTISESRIRAYRTVSRELIDLYLKIGKKIAERQEQEGWESQ